MRGSSAVVVHAVVGDSHRCRAERLLVSRRGAYRKQFHLLFILSSTGDYALWSTSLSKKHNKCNLRAKYKTKRRQLYLKTRPYRAVNTFHFRYKNLSVYNNINSQPDATITSVYNNINSQPDATITSVYNNINSQPDATITSFIDNYNKLNVFPEIIRSIRRCIVQYHKL